MSKIKIACTNCGNQGEVDECHLGRRVQCNKCKTAFVIQRTTDINAALETPLGTPEPASPIAGTSLADRVRMAAIRKREEEDERVKAAEREAQERDKAVETEREARIEKARSELALQIESGNLHAALVAAYGLLQLIPDDREALEAKAAIEGELGPNQVIENAKDGSLLALIPAGEFIMGSEEYDNEKPQRQVYLDAYYIDIYPVTVKQYRQYCEATGKQMPVTPSWGWQEDHPVVNVNWADASAYAEWAGKRLPTEAEWEKAARGTDGRRFPWGNEWDGSKCANSIGSGLSSTKPVDSYPEGVSPYGIHDMAGNVWEWCANWYDENYYKNAPARNPQGPQAGADRVLRGGSWPNSGDSDFRAAYRCWGNPGFRNFVNGFRCVEGL